MLNWFTKVRTFKRFSPSWFVVMTIRWTAAILITIYMIITGIIKMILCPVLVVIFYILGDRNLSYELVEATKDYWNLKYWSF